MGFSHRRTHHSKTYTANDRLSSRNTGVKITDSTTARLIATQIIYQIPINYQHDLG
jgi:hypothetical protein